MMLGKKDGKTYYLDQDLLTKELRLEVYNIETRKKRIYTNKRMIRKIFCMIV